MLACISNRSIDELTMNNELWKIRNFHHTIDNNIYVKHLDGPRTIALEENCPQPQS